MLKRVKYLNELIEAKDLNLIKVITGVRRCGKSTLLLQYKDYLLDNGVNETDVVYMSFESAEWYDIKDYRDLYNYVKSKYKNKKLYLLLDEVQNVEKWEKAVNSFLVDIKCDIYVTGSNAKLLSSELTTLVAGRVYTIKMYPFSFAEYIEALKDSNKSKYELFDDYLKYGGMPMLIDMNDNERLKVNYLSDIKDVVLKKDIIARNKIKDVVFLDNLLRYMSTVIGTLINPNTISYFMKKNGSSLDNETVDKYLKMIENAHFIYRVPRYELKGKQLLKTQGKYYFVDNGLKNVLAGFASYDSGSSYENIIFMELLRRGYEVYVGKYNDLEIDFVATSPNEKIYYQVTRSLLSEEVENREKKSLLAINDNYKKVILTMDITFNKSIEGIEVKNIIDFLLEK